MRVTNAMKAPFGEAPARLQGWETRLVEWLTSDRGRPIVWGQSDCATRVADVCQAMTGFDPMEVLRGRYASELDAAKIMAARGCADMGDMLAQAFPEVAPSAARRGDVGTVVDRRGVVGAVIVEGDLVSGAGGTFMSRLRLARAFRVGA